MEELTRMMKNYDERQYLILKNERMMANALGNIKKQNKVEIDLKLLWDTVMMLKQKYD